MRSDPFSCLLQVFCVTNFFAQPVEPVVSQEEEEEASHTSLQDNPSNGNHYGSTDWPWDPKKESSVQDLYHLNPWNSSILFKLLALFARVLNRVSHCNGANAIACRLQPLPGVAVKLWFQEDKYTKEAELPAKF